MRNTDWIIKMWIKSPRIEMVGIGMEILMDSYRSFIVFL